MTSTAMPPIKNLFVESWDTLKASFGNIFILSLLGSILSFIFFIIVFIGIAGVGIISALSKGV